MSDLAQEFLGVLRSFASRWDPSEFHRLFAELSKLFLTQGRMEVADRLGMSEHVRLLETWRDRFLRSLSLELPSVRILCLLNSVEDVVWAPDRNNLNQFITDLHKQAGSSGTWDHKKKSWVSFMGDRDEFIREAEKRARSGKNAHGGSITGRVAGFVDVLAALLYPWIMDKPALKPIMVQPEVRKWMDNYIGAKPDIMHLLGGASGNMADALRKLGLDVTCWWAYHPQGIAQLCPDCLKWIVFDAKNLSGQPISAQVGQRGHPLKRSVILQYAPGLEVRLSDKNKTLIASSSRYDRLIYQFRWHVGKRSWDRIVARTLKPNGTVDRKVHILDDPVNPTMAADEWPFFPLLGWWTIENKKLVFTIAPQHVVKQVGQAFDYILLSSPRALGNDLLNLPENKRARQMLLSGLRRQVRTLADAGAVIHCELGGITEPGLAEEVRQVIQSGVRSVGLNEQETVDTTGDARMGTSGLFFAPAPIEGAPPEPIYKRYQRASHLGKWFRVEEVYVHGNEADLVLRRDTCRGAIWLELEANLLAKALIVLSILQRTLSDWTGVVAKIIPVLAEKGFKALLDLASDIASASGGTFDQALFRQIAFQGYLFQRDSGPDASFSLHVVPVMWPEHRLPPDISTAGAGDATSAFVAVLSGK